MGRLPRTWPKQYGAAEKIFKAASAAELDDLILVVKSGSIDDQHVALSTLEHFSRAKLDTRWSLARRDRLVHVLRKHVVERYPDDVARHSVSVLRIMDFAWLGEFLTGISLEQVSEEGRAKLEAEEIQSAWFLTLWLANCYFSRPKHCYIPSQRAQSALVVADLKCIRAG